MELSEDAKYRLCYLALRLAFDRKLSAGNADARPGMLALLDVIAGTQLASEAGGRRWNVRAAALALLFAGLYAVSDELHQWFVPGRTAAAMDCLIDFTGAVAGQGLLAARAAAVALRLRPLA